MAGRILWDVDTQVDFMEPSGKLYIPDAADVAGTMGRLVDAARAAHVIHIASADDHELTDPEISNEPDFQNTYPPHCLRGTRGAERIAETKQVDPLPLTLVPFPPGLIPGMLDGRREVLLLKKNLNPFTNPHTDLVLDVLDPDEIILFGVATDICDDVAIRAFLRRGRRVTFVEDAAKGLDEERTRACTAAWRESGVAFATADEVIASLG